MRFADAYQAIPEILLAIVVVAVFGGSAGPDPGARLRRLESYTRVAFNLTRSLRERPFVEAAVARGRAAATSCGAISCRRCRRC